MSTSSPLDIWRNVHSSRRNDITLNAQIFLKRRIKFCKLTSTIAALLFLAGCDQSEISNLRQENNSLKERIAELDATLSKKPKELDREDAAKIITEYLKAKQAKRVEFRDGQVKVAEADGVLLTATVNEFQLHLDYQSPDFGRVVEMISTAVWQPGMNPYVEFRSPISEKLAEITGIGPESQPGKREVSFRTEYDFPPAIQPLIKYLYSGVKRTAIVERWDDGWRAANND